MLQWNRIDNDLLDYLKNLLGKEAFKERKKTLPKLLVDKRVSVWLFETQGGEPRQYRASIRRRDLGYNMRETTTYSIMNPSLTWVILDTLGKIEAMPLNIKTP